MDIENQCSRTRRFGRWLTRKHKRPDLYNFNESSGLRMNLLFQCRTMYLPFQCHTSPDPSPSFPTIISFAESLVQIKLLAGRVEDEDDNMDDLHYRSTEMGPCTSSNLLRVFGGTWNVAGRSPVGSLAVDLDEWLNLKEAADIYVLGFQEIVPLIARTVIGAEDPTEATNWNQLIWQTLNEKHRCPWLTLNLNQINSDSYQYSGVLECEQRLFAASGTTTSVTGQPSIQNQEQNESSRYELIVSKKMVGVFISVWMKRALVERYSISSVKVSSAACGIRVIWETKVQSRSVCLLQEPVFASLLYTWLLVRRRARKEEGITKSKKFSDEQISLDSLMTNSRIFWFGDLNYRLYLKDNLARQLIKKQDWGALQEFDQLRKELEDGGVFEGWKEGNIEFAPTYKYSSVNCNRYSGGLSSRAGEKKRTPAWCDRILWYGKGVKQLSYLRSESKFSDHRPVSSLFSTQIEAHKSANPRLV